MSTQSDRLGLAKLAQPQHLQGEQTLVLGWKHLLGVSRKLGNEHIEGANCELLCEVTELRTFLQWRGSSREGVQTNTRPLQEPPGLTWIQMRLQLGEEPTGPASELRRPRLWECVDSGKRQHEQGVNRSIPVTLRVFTSHSPGCKATSANAQVNQNRDKCAVVMRTT